MVQKSGDSKVIWHWTSILDSSYRLSFHGCRTVIVPCLLLVSRPKICPIIPNAALCFFAQAEHHKGDNVYPTRVHHPIEPNHWTSFFSKHNTFETMPVLTDCLLLMHAVLSTHRLMTEFCRHLSSLPKHCRPWITKIITVNERDPRA